MTIIREIKYAIQIVLCILILSSCSIQKRRYSAGYNIDISSFPFLSKGKKVIRPDTTTVEKKNAQRNLKKHSTIADSDLEDVLWTSTQTAEQHVVAGSVSKISAELPQNVQNKKNHSSRYSKPGNKNNLIKTDTLEQKKTHLKQHQTSTQTKRKIAIITGGSLILMAIIAMITVPMLTSLFVSGNAAQTALNVSANFSSFTGAVIGWIAILLLDIIVSIGIYQYYKDENPKMAKIASALRMAYSIILGIGILQLLRVTASTPATAIYNSINMFTKFWGIGLIVFGFHLIALGILFNNEKRKKWVNVTIKTLLITAGIGYVIQYVGILLVANPAAYAALVQPIFLTSMILGEISYAIWKLAKGGKSK